MSLQGVLHCPCGRLYPIVNSIPRFVDAENYASTFGFQWLVHPRTQLDHNTSDDRTGRLSNQSERLLRQLQITPESVNGLTILDAGCGTGRFAEVLSRWGARVVAVDLSRAVEAARENLADHPNACVVQADLLSLPFAPETFDAIISIGVLHHTPDCRKTFLSLIPFLKPGGWIAIWVYSDHDHLHNLFSKKWRGLTTRIPPSLLYRLCYLAVPLGPIYRHSWIFGEFLQRILPMPTWPNWRWRVLSAFDWYSPRYQSKHSYPEVWRWFREAGLSDIHLFDWKVSLRGRKPVSR